MNFTSAFLFAFSANVDSLAIGLSYGIQEVKITWKSNFLIAIITSIGTLLSMKLGHCMTQFIPIYWANIVGCCILTTMGSLVIYEYIQNYLCKKIKHMDIEEYDRNKSGVIESKEAIRLACGLTFNNIALGIGASVTGVSVILSTSLTFMFSLVFIHLSQLIGKLYLSKYFGQNMALISGIIIFMLGIYELFL